MRLWWRLIYSWMGLLKNSLQDVIIQQQKLRDDSRHLKISSVRKNRYICRHPTKKSLATPWQMTTSKKYHVHPAIRYQSVSCLNEHVPDRILGFFYVCLWMFTQQIWFKNTELELFKVLGSFLEDTGSPFLFKTSPFVDDQSLVRSDIRLLSAHQILPPSILTKPGATGYLQPGQQKSHGRWVWRRNGSLNHLNSQDFFVSTSDHVLD